MGAYALNRYQLYLNLFCLLLGIFLLLFADDSLARAGGGGSFSGGGSSYSSGSSGGSDGPAAFWGIVLSPIFFAFSGIATYVARKKHLQAKALAEQIAQQDKIWDLSHIKARIEETYFKVQIAWRERDQEIAREYMSDRLYNKHKLQTDDLIRNKRINMLEQINLSEAMIVEILDYTDDSKDAFWALIKGQMVDYMLDEESGEVIRGSTTTSDPFEELWRFKREAHGWVLDEIDQEVTLSDFRSFKPYSESAES
jgi:preprotein translocase subunit SecG